jgi:hypothetical protein
MPCRWLCLLGPRLARADEGGYNRAVRVIADRERDGYRIPIPWAKATGEPATSMASLSG